MTRTRVLSGRYVLESPLGEGGMATVFRGTDRLLGRRVAVKVLARDFARDHRAVQRFRREAQAAAGLNHPNVVSVFDTGSDDDAHYIVMEHLEGRTLAEVLREGGPLPAFKAVEVALAVCRALSSAHAQGMVHRDVKPGNILLTTDGGVKVTDFGIASVVSDERLTVTGSVMGTASYLSPEQAKGEGVDARSDIYSLGCVVYEMLTGHPPFEGTNPVSIAYKHVEEAPPPPRSIDSAIAQQLEAVVLKALAKKKEARYQTAQEMAAALQAAALPVAGTVPAGLPGEEPTAVLPVSPGGPASTAPLPAAVTREQRRRWWPLAAGAAALAILGVVLAFTLGNDEVPGSAGGRATPRGPAPTSPTPAATSPVPPIPSVEAAFQEVLAAAAVPTAVTAEARQEIFERAQDALIKYDQGDQGEALQKLAELRGKLIEFTNEEQVAPDQAESILRAVNLLAAAMEAVPPPSPPGDDEGGPGGGKGKGQGKNGGGEED